MESYLLPPGVVVRFHVDGSDPLFNVNAPDNDEVARSLPSEIAP